MLFVGGVRDGDHAIGQELIHEYLERRFTIRNVALAAKDVFGDHCQVGHDALVAVIAECDGIDHGSVIPLVERRLGGSIDPVPADTSANEHQVAFGRCQKGIVPINDS